MQMQSNEWKLPLNFAIGIHVMILLAALYLPGIFKAKPKFAEIYTVSLINVAEPVAAPPAAKAPAPSQTPAKAAPAPPPAAPPKAKKVIEVPEKVEPAPAPAPVPAPPPAPTKAISLKPLKQKIVKNVKEPEPETPPKKNDQDLKKVQKLAEAIREEATKEETLKKETLKREEMILTERARLAQEAVDQERQLLAQSNKVQARMAQQAAEAAVGQQSNTPAVSGSSSNLLESQYQAAIASRLQQFWSLPEHLQKDPNLLATVVITIKIDGDIANMIFENKSGDRIFDQYVSKTIEAANPLPPIPPALKKQRYEIGFRFKPGSIQ
jgi:colicin import membrane protein